MQYQKNKKEGIIMKMSLSGFLQGRVNMLMYRKMGWGFIYYYIILLGKLYFLLNRRERQKIAESVESVFVNRKNKSEIGAITRSVLRGILFHYYEKLFNAYENIEGLKSFFEESIEAKYLNKLDHALKKGRGLLFVTGHYGGIEYIPIFLALRQYPISVIAKFKTTALKDTLYSKTKGLGLRIIDASQKASILGTILKELRKNRIVFIECDEIEEWKPSQKERMFFLGKWIGVDKTVNLIQKRTGAEIIFGILHRFTVGRYSLIIEDYQDLLQRLGKKPSSVGEAVLRFFEQYIYSYPEEWYQWKKYANIEGIPAFEMKAERRAFAPVLRPAFDELA
jgi:lauroyl/myristoyl acyltransferase